jgi:hypothetical protein
MRCPQRHEDDREEQRRKIEAITAGYTTRDTVDHPIRMTRSERRGGLLRPVRSLLAMLTVLLAVGLLAGCGSKSSNTETTSPVAAATAWAGGVCLAFTTWKQDLVDASNSLKANPNQTQLYESVSAAKTATTDLKNTITGIGKPPVANSQSAQAALDTLRTQLTTSVATIQSSIDSVSSVTGAAAVVPGEVELRRCGPS